MDWATLITTDVARLLQYAGASVLFGTALFSLTILPLSGEASAAKQSWPTRLFLGAAIALLAGAILSLLAQSASMNGVPLSQLDMPALQMVVSDTQWGHAIIVRVAVSVVALTVALARQGNTQFGIFTGLGIATLASFAFTGHGASDDGAAGLVHLLSDMIHSVAAGIWLGALAGFFALLSRCQDGQGLQPVVLTKALANFAAIGTATVAVLVVTGLMNSYFLIGNGGLPKIFTSPYGDLLVLKLSLFAGMLVLAAENRFRLTPALAKAPDATSRMEAIARLRRSVTLESLAGLAILALVAIFGMLEPPGTT